MIFERSAEPKAIVALLSEPETMATGLDSRDASPAPLFRSKPLLGGVPLPVFMMY